MRLLHANLSPLSNIPSAAHTASQPPYGDRCPSVSSSRFLLSLSFSPLPTISEHHLETQLCRQEHGVTHSCPIWVRRIAYCSLGAPRATGKRYVRCGAGPAAPRRRSPLTRPAGPAAAAAAPAPPAACSPCTRTFRTRGARARTSRARTGSRACEEGRVRGGRRGGGWLHTSRQNGRAREGRVSEGCAAPTPYTTDRPALVELYEDVRTKVPRRHVDVGSRHLLLHSRGAASQSST